MNPRRPQLVDETPLGSLGNGDVGDMALGQPVTFGHAMGNVIGRIRAGLGKRDGRLSVTGRAVPRELPAAEAGKVIKLIGSARRTFSSCGPRNGVFSGVAMSLAPAAAASRMSVKV